MLSRKDAANTITTWVLPIIGLIVQAPWESNQAWETTLAFFRYLGSPISVLSYILWNIKVQGKAALMVDMSTKYHEYPAEGSEFSHMRDSMYILCVMNQYSIKPSLPAIESERLLRIALFSNKLQLNSSMDDRDNIVARRTELARVLREGRKKGVIPVFVSFLWFVFALALSVELAYDSIGGNQTAHNLALGLLVGWLPVLVVASTVDRNSVSADSIRERLNDLVEEVRRSLLGTSRLEDHKQATNDDDCDSATMGPLHDTEIFDGNFFMAFGGQGRTPFHYGVAHPILSGIETKFMAQYGRDWLRHGYAARRAMVIGTINMNGLKMFDSRFTPTVGLGCRTGGYLVHIILALSLLLIEFSAWAFTYDKTHTHDDICRRVSTRLEHRFTDPEKGLSQDSRLQKMITRLRGHAFRDVVKTLIIRPLEAINAGWLIYIIAAQTFGSYQTCECFASTWSQQTGGGYIDFAAYDYYAARGVYVYWSAGVGLSCSVMACGLLYIAHEYCTQSNLSTEHYGRAMKGLEWTRAYKKYSRFVRLVPDMILTSAKYLTFRITGGTTRNTRRSLVWTVDPKPRAGIHVFGLDDGVES
ncbi:uncharacterized protein KY384_004971 [Bacidia gigantensis]|uniref:uncharacterized protein n=1 Tax=Bacidia gigantensis TaxID=2732470 RepID=UPI001D03D158|nr:uncharacterized protein KY384_004971 [Bacidia gigantensis]KAG8530468.1 hypothetical protein KY384_004971 [Bacidia gigantensis]